MYNIKQQILFKKEVIHVNLPTEDNGRYSGILVHPTSFPSPYGIGDMGEGAYGFIDFLEAAGQTLWQCLPLGPTSFGDSPYQSFSSFAGQPLIISPDLLIQDGLLAEEDVADMPKWDDTHVDYGEAILFKTRLLRKAYEHFKQTPILLYVEEFQAFCKKEGSWLDNYALFMALKDAHDGRPWSQWEAPYRTLEPLSIEIARQELADDIDYYRFIQYIFYKQWAKLKDYAASKHITIIGDIPIFVALDSADVWADQQLFNLDENGFPTVVAGVPPDYFSATGQLWGNPLYLWKNHRKDGYRWWIRRIRHQLRLTDMLRIDHFRGFEAYWSIPYGEETAIHGKWVTGPGTDFFDAVIQALGKHLPIIAEDLGIITPAVEALRDHYGFPGMRVLQFGFDNTAENNYLPHNFIRNCICYTGTHDNDTTIGWYAQASEDSRDKVRRYMNTDGSSVHWDFIRAALSSTAKYAIFPLQDVLGLGSKARMNIPGVAGNNWAWRFQSKDLKADTAAHLRSLSLLFGRTGGRS